MHPGDPSVRPLSVLAGALALLPAWGAAQPVVANYALTAPVLLAEPDPGAASPLLRVGPLRFSGIASGYGTGLSLEAGRHWFARVGVGRSLADETLSLGGGYRFADRQAISMQFTQVTRQLGQERLGLAIRYEDTRAYLRLAYEVPGRSWNGLGDSLRFSAGLRF